MKPLASLLMALGGLASGVAARAGGVHSTGVHVVADCSLDPTRALYSAVASLRTARAGSTATRATLTIRGLDDDIRDRLRLRAATHGRSMEAEARSILAEAVSSPIERSLVDFMLAMRETLDGERMELPERADQVRDPFA